MELSEEQKRTVAEWVRAGATLSEVQRRLQEEMTISMTYMDVRFLVDDLEVDLRDPEPTQPEPTKMDPGAESDNPREASGQAAEANADLFDEGRSSGSVSVEIDPVQRPGAVVSGSVIFSDGVKSEWYVDQLGRLGLNPSKPGYQPSPEDIQDFQMELQRALQSKGL